jgi:hypothetical protein
MSGELNGKKTSMSTKIRGKTIENDVIEKKKRLVNPIQKNYEKVELICLILTISFFYVCI